MGNFDHHLLGNEAVEFSETEAARYQDLTARLAELWPPCEDQEFA